MIHISTGHFILALIGAWYIGLTTMMTIVKLIDRKYK